MSIAMIEESEIPEGFQVFTLVHNRKPADSVGQVVMSKGGQHPKCKLVSMAYNVLAYASAVDVLAIEDGDGTDAGTVTGGAAIGISVNGDLVEGQVFERNEAICANLTTDGNAANAGILTGQFVSVH